MFYAIQKKYIRYIVISLMLLTGLMFWNTMSLQAAKALVQEKVKISSFITPSAQEITIFEKETLEEISDYFPKVLEAVNEQGENIEIPVFWECTGDYEQTNFYYYQFLPVIDKSSYIISEKLEIPYIWLVLSDAEEMTRAVTSSANETKIYNFLVNELNCNFATALGILANIERESGFNPKAQYPASGDALYYGICQWGGSRLNDLKEYCSKNGYSLDSVEGQLKFLQYELYGTEARAWSKMQGIEDSAEGAYTAGYNWARYFERCASVYYEVSAKRARDVYWPNYATEAPVYRISGTDRYKTGIKIADRLKEVLGIDKFDNLVIATGKDYADALSGSYLAHVKKAPILLTNGKNVSQIKQYAEKNLKSGGTIYLLGGSAVIPESLEKELLPYSVKRLSGKTRYDTNLEILKEAGGETKELLICTGKKFADSLSASALGKPILLVKDGLKEEQLKYLETLKVENIYLIGGESVVNAETALALETYGSIHRIFGKTRYETSVLVAQTFCKGTRSAVLTYSKNFPDGLCGGVLAAAMKSPLILTMTGQINAADQYLGMEKITGGYVLGGNKLISDEALRKLFDLKISERITVY